MDRRIAPTPWSRLVEVVGLAIVGVVLVIYAIPNLVSPNNLYNHFVWQASAWLEGQATIRYPVTATADEPGDDYFNDVFEIQDQDGLPTGRGMLPFPPLPAAVLVPFVALWGLTTDAQRISAILATIDVGLAFWMLGRLRVRPVVRVAVTIFFAFGSAFLYTGVKGSTWFFAHVVAVGLTIVAVGIALGADRLAAEAAVERSLVDEEDASGPWSDPRRWGWHGFRTIVDGRQFLAGLLLGLAATARLTVIFGAPFLVFVGGGGSWLRRGFSAALGAAIPLGALLVYNQASTGHWFNPVYDVLYQQEAGFYTFLNYHSDWAIEDLRYVPGNFMLMLAGPPDIMPTFMPFGQELCTAAGSVRDWFNPDCPIVAPKQVGMGLLLTSPAWFLALPTARRIGWNRLVTGAVLAVLLIAFVNLAHFSQGWVQFGYRFSDDFAPFALVLLALGLEWRGVGRLAVALIVVSLLVNAWGVFWALRLGW